MIGNVLVYLDDNHLTASYSTSMAPLVEGDVLAALGLSSASPAHPWG